MDSLSTISTLPEAGSTEISRVNESHDLDSDMKFNEGHVVSIISYSILMVVAIIGNCTVLYLIHQRRKTNRSRINTMLMHLAVADLLVATLMVPFEIGWNIKVTWEAGDVMCRIMAFFRTFGHYLSCFVLVCISVDRYYAVLKPLQLMDVDRRGKIMLIGAWMGSIICSAPQMAIFHVETHPNHTWYTQCISFNTFKNDSHDLSYKLFGMITMYCFPLIVIIYTYSSILREIYRKSRESVGEFHQDYRLKKLNPQRTIVSHTDKIRRSSLGFLGKAKIRTLKMTIIIILAFFICWTPYYIMSVWYWFDKASAKELDQRIQKGLFIFACTNSCMNPIVYGVFNIRRTTKNSTSQRVGTNGKKTSLDNVVCRVSWKRRDTSSREPSLPNDDALKPSADICLDIVNHTIGKNDESKDPQHPSHFIKFRLLRYHPISLHWLIWRFRNQFYIT